MDLRSSSTLLALAIASAAPACSEPAARGAAAIERGSTTMTQSADSGAALAQLVEAALTDAERVSGRPRSALKLIDAAAVDWPDGAGGCPQPGVMYTQAIVPGYRIRIQSGAEVLNYHATRFSRQPMLCPADRVQPALPSRGGLT